MPNVASSFKLSVSVVPREAASHCFLLVLHFSLSTVCFLTRAASQPLHGLIQELSRCSAAARSSLQPRLGLKVSSLVPQQEDGSCP